MGSLTITTTPVIIVKAGNADTPFQLETSILNTDVVRIAYSNSDVQNGNWRTLSPASKLDFHHFKGNLWAMANSGSQTVNISQYATDYKEDYIPWFESDVSALLIAALPVDLLAASGQTYAGGLGVTITSGAYIFAANSSAFIGEVVYNVPIQVEIYILSETNSATLTIYRTLGAVTAQASETFSITHGTPAKLLIPLDVGETFNMKYGANDTWLKFAVRQIPVTYATVS
jgi:hypothetical protein